jgi:hypothetical protein
MFKQYDLVYCCGDEIVNGYLNIYRIERHYGGPEEGGWWYTWIECIGSVPCPRDQVEKIYEAMKDLPAYQSEGNIYSVLGGFEIHWNYERDKAESASKEQPHYE